MVPYAYVVTGNVDDVRVFSDVEERVKMRAVRREISSRDVQTDGAGAGCVGVPVASLAVRAQRQCLPSFGVDDDDARLAD